MAVAGGGRSLEQTPTWAVATFCFVLVLISIIIDYIIHLVGKWFKQKQKRALYEALEKIKSVGQSLISDNCKPESAANTWHPCTKEREEELNKVATTDQEETESEHRCRLLMVAVGSGCSFRRVLAAAASTNKCAAKAAMNSVKPFCVVLMVLVLGLTGIPMAVMCDVSTERCEFPALYNFGDSNSDTGGNSAAMAQLLYQMGKLSLDIPLEDSLMALRYLSAYLDSIGTSFRQGANFASAGKTPPFRSVLPRPRDFSRALYTFDIGQNDLAYGFKHSNEDQQLYKEGARFFWIHNTGPIGCLPDIIIGRQSKPSDLDQNGCEKSHNEVAREFNKQLKNRIMSQLRVQLPQAAFTYVDVYAVKYALISNATNQVATGMEQFVIIHQCILAGIQYTTQRQPTSRLLDTFSTAPSLTHHFQFTRLVIIPPTCDHNALRMNKWAVSIEVELHKLKGLVSDALQDPDAKGMVSGDSGTECLEALLRKLIEHYSALSMAKPLLDLEEAMSNLMHVKEERDVYVEKQKSLICDVDALDRKREELQEQLIQEEQKSVSLREKLNVAGRKGKSLVQQRDSLKQTLEELNNEVDRLKSEISQRENTLADNEQKIRGLSAYPEMVEALESESVFLRDRLTETEHVLQEREHILNSTINALGDIDVGGEVTTDDPVEKLKQFGKLLHDWHASLASSEQE
ncbi:hypothetical protein Ddye_007754 [Dipteronia dyeriana]|uniref:Uncharacterized protein n=1 Tax=Dipteronia dyeriana TaxID=168575 RepID=A0AAD9XL11_9ROSI|nr:hypothetical protein Ddye_007754 [Dipteronia dyeriana]